MAGRHVSFFCHLPSAIRHLLCCPPLPTSAPTRTAVIIGAGPAGLTAAYELLERTDIRPIVLEATNELGGIARTVNYKGNRIDIGGHRFFRSEERRVGKEGRSRWSP